MASKFWVQSVQVARRCRLSSTTLWGLGSASFLAVLRVESSRPRTGFPELLTFLSVAKRLRIEAARSESALPLTEISAAGFDISPVRVARFERHSARICDQITPRPPPTFVPYSRHHSAIAITLTKPYSWPL